MRVSQVLFELNPGDAIGNDVIEIKHALMQMGYDTDIFAKHIHPEFSNFAKQLGEYREKEGNIVIYHLPIAGFDVTEFVKLLSDTKVLIYHNITPPQYFEGINEYAYTLCLHGREELAALSNVVTLALGDSEYNKNELDLYGFKNTGILPILIDFSKYSLAPNKTIMELYNDDYVNLLFVGRIAPNKKQEDLIRIFYYYNKINPRSRLFLIGSFKGMDKYIMRLLRLVERLNLPNVIFTGSVPFDELIAYYRLADIFLCMSEHEGFCVPLLESMYFKIPIIAYNSTAVPYTLRDSGILVNNKNYVEIAEMVSLLVKDDELRKEIVKKQEKRLKDFDKSIVESKLKEYIDRVIYA